MTKQVLYSSKDTEEKFRAFKVNNPSLHLPRAYTTQFFKQCVDTWNIFVITRTQQEILPVICDIVSSANQTYKGTPPSPPPTFR